VAVEATVETQPLLAIEPSAPFTLVQDLPDSALQYLLPSRYCPADWMTQRALQRVGNAADGYSQVEAIRRWIQQNLAYRYGSSDASTDAVGTLESGAGIMPGLRPCRDRPGPRAAHPGTYGGRLSAGPGGHGPPQRGRHIRPTCSPGRGADTTGVRPRATMTARSMTLRSSRTFPGHE
jgi:hypothetical protein